MSEKVKFSSKLDEELLEDLRIYSKESNKNISTVLTEAVEDYLKKVRLRPAFLSASKKVLAKNKDLLKRLAK